MIKKHGTIDGVIDSFAKIYEMSAFNIEKIR